MDVWVVLRGHQRDFSGTDYIMDVDAGYTSIRFLKTHQAEHMIFLPVKRHISLQVKKKKNTTVTKMGYLYKADITYRKK